MEKRRFCLGVRRGRQRSASNAAPAAMDVPAGSLWRRPSVHHHEARLWMCGLVGLPGWVYARLMVMHGAAADNDDQEDHSDRSEECHRKFSIQVSILNVGIGPAVDAAAWVGRWTQWPSPRQSCSGRNRSSGRKRLSRDTGPRPRSLRPVGAEPVDHEVIGDLRRPSPRSAVELRPRRMRTPRPKLWMSERAPASTHETRVAHRAITRVLNEEHDPSLHRCVVVVSD